MAHAPRSFRGLTLVELVAALAVLALAAAVLAPALLRARASQADDREQLVAKLTIRALASYALDNADALVPAHPNWSWVHPSGNPATPAMRPIDPLDPARRLQGTIAKTWSAHIAVGRGLTLEMFQHNPQTAALFNARTPLPSTHSQNLVDYSASSRAAGFLWHTSLGYNGIFVGGSYRHRAHSDQPFGLTNNAAGGEFYVKRFSQVVAPSRLIAFTTARGGDVALGSFWSFGQAYPNAGTIHPGYWLVTPPRAGGVNGAMNWSQAPAFNPIAPASTWGNVDFRAGLNSKALVVQMDGSNQTLDMASLRDMRRWANQATSPTWQWSPGLNATP